MFTCFTIMICFDQMVRFLNEPIVISLERDYRNWIYQPLDITICTDFVNETVLEQLVNNQFVNITKRSDDYNRFFEVVALANSGNIQEFDQFEGMESLKMFSGEDLLYIATEVNIFFNYCFLLNFALVLQYDFHFIKISVEKAAKLA